MASKSYGSVRVFWPTLGREALVARLRECLPALRAALPVRRVGLFGSQAAGRATVASDIDVLVVYSGPPRDDAYRTVRAAIPLRGLEPHVYTEEEAGALAVVLERMTRGAIRLL